MTLARDASGAWIASVPSMPGCHSYGRSIQQARNRIREALSLWVEDAHRVTLELDIRLPRHLGLAIERAATARAEAEEAAARASAETLAAIRKLEGAGLSRRDVGSLLGLSHQRIQQLSN